MNTDGTPENGEEQRPFTSFTDKNETGWDRLKSTFTSNEYGERSPELDFVWTSLWSSFVCGGLTGAILAGQEAKADFIRKNQETIFSHPYLAKRRYIDAMIIAMSKRGYSWAWRLALFTGSLTTVTTALAVHRNHLCVHHFTAAGALTGGLFRLSMGSKAVFASSVLGATLATGAGSLIVGAMWLTGTTLEEMRYWHYDHWQKELRQKKEQVRKTEQEKLAEKNEDLGVLAWHDRQVKDQDRDKNGTESI